VRPGRWVKPAAWTALSFAILGLPLRGEKGERAPRFELRPSSAAAAPGKRFGRAALLNLAMLGGLGGLYWIQVEINKLDWDFELTWKDQVDRFFNPKNIRQDTNSFEVNALHGGQGAMTHLMARNGGLSVGESLLFGVASSSVWEYVFEFREMISLNDQIVTPLAGLVLGENLFQLGRYLRRPGGKRGLSFLGWLFDPVAGVNGWLDGGGESPAGGVARDSSMGGWVPTLSLTLENRFWGFREPGIASTPYAALRASMRWSGGRPAELFVNSRLIWGAATALPEADEAGPGRRWRFFGGLSSALDAAVSLSDLEEFDKFLAVDGLGVAGGGVRSGPDGNVRVTAGLYGSFAALRPAALPAFRKTDDLFYAKSILREWGYYFAFGYSFAGEVAGRWRNIEWRADLRHHVCDSLEGRDRWPATVLRDFNLTDTRTFWSLQGILRLGRGDVMIFGRGEGCLRSGRVNGIRASSRNFSVLAGLAFSL